MRGSCVLCGTVTVHPCMLSQVQYVPVAPWVAKLHRPAKEGQAGQGADGAVAVADDDDPPLLVNGQKVSKEQARLRPGLAATLPRCNLIVLMPPACMQVFWPKEGAHSTPDAPALIEEAPKAVWSPASHKLHFSDAGSFFSEVSIFHAR